MENKESSINKKRILVLTETDKEIDPMFNAWVEAGLNADLLFAPVKTKITRAIRRLWLNGVLPGPSMWYGTWKKSLDKYDLIIIHASELTRTIPKWIRSKKQDVRIIYWYWNPVNAKSLPSLIDDEKTETWSFDSDDCKRYGMKQNIQYYYDSKDETESSVEYDVYFVGHDKGRSEQLDNLQKEMKKLGITYKFEVIKENEPNIPYSQVRRNIQKSRAILEINQAGQEGYTLRALEALFFQKKLITTNESIELEPFYRNENIYIIGKDNRTLKDFMETEFVDTSDNRHAYDIDAWIKNFYKI